MSDRPFFKREKGGEDSERRSVSLWLPHAHTHRYTHKYQKKNKIVSLEAKYKQT